MNKWIWVLVAIIEFYLFVFFDQFFHDRESIGYINYLMHGGDSKYNYTDFFDGLYYQPYLILLMQLMSSIYIFRHFMPQIREKLNNFNNLSISIQLFPLLFWILKYTNNLVMDIVSSIRHSSPTYPSETLFSEINFRLTPIFPSKTMLIVIIISVVRLFIDQKEVNKNKSIPKQSKTGKLIFLTPFLLYFFLTSYYAGGYNISLHIYLYSVKNWQILKYLIEYYYIRSNLLVILTSIVCAIIYFIFNRNIMKSKWVEKYIEYSILLLYVYLLMLTQYGTIQNMLPDTDLSVNDYIVYRGLQPFGLLFLLLNSILWVTTIEISKIIRKDILVVLNRTLDS